MCTPFDHGQIDLIPDEIWLEILSFLNPSELLKIRTISNYFKRKADTNFLWSKHTTQLFKGKFSHFILKTAPNPENKMNLYFYALRDSKRLQITKEEASSILWFMRFKQRSYGFYIKFFENGTLECEGNYSLTPEWVWFIGKKCICVNNFQPHFCRRTEDWGWVCANHWVYFYSVAMTYQPIPKLALSSELLTIANKEKDIGNEFFKKGDTFHAKLHYHYGLHAILNRENVSFFNGPLAHTLGAHGSNVDVDGTGKLARHLSGTLLSNLAVCWIKEANYHEGLHYSQNAEYLFKTEGEVNVKVLYRMSLCLFLLGKKAQALAILKPHINIDPILAQRYKDLSEADPISPSISYDISTLRGILGNYVNRKQDPLFLDGEYENNYDDEEDQ